MEQHDFPRGVVSTSGGEPIGEIRRDDVERTLADEADRT